MQLMKPSFLLRLEGAAMFALALILYWLNGESWLWFVILILAPDLSALGYLAGAPVGSLIYNLAHTEVLPAILVVIGLLTHSTLGLAIALTWFAHIGVDRLAGFGLKYPTHFKDNHLGRV